MNPIQTTSIFLNKTSKKNNFADVTIVSKALASVEKTVGLWLETMIISTWVNSIAIPKDPKESEVVTVETTLLSSYLQDEVDFLKMDIEGSEEQVLQEAGNRLTLVRQIELEFHGTTKNNDINSLERVVNLLEKQGFEVQVEVKDVSKIFLRHSINDRVNFHYAQVRAVNKKFR